jgi:hypothetical protein
MASVTNQGLNHGIQVPMFDFQFDNTLVQKRVRSVHSHIVCLLVDETIQISMVAAAGPLNHQFPGLAPFPAIEYREEPGPTTVIQL